MKQLMLAPIPYSKHSQLPLAGFCKQMSTFDTPTNADDQLTNERPELKMSFQRYNGAMNGSNYPIGIALVIMFILLILKTDLCCVQSFRTGRQFELDWLAAF